MTVEDFEEKVDFLNSTLLASLGRLLEEARSKDVILPPYGRPPTPTPFCDDNEELDDLNDEDASTDDSANFKYQYGFNPLLFLGDFLHRAHPTSISLKKRKQSEAMSRLKRRADHAKHQQKTAHELKVRALQLRRY
jgi:hypothetical protein